MVIHKNNTTGTITDNNGTTPFTESLQEATADTSVYAILYRVAGSSEPSSYAWTATGSTAWSINLRVFSGVDNVNVWDVAPSTATRNTSTGSPTATAPTMTTVTNGAMGIAHFITDSGSVTYSGQTNGYGTEVEAGSGQAQASYIRIWATAGSTGTTAGTLSATNDWVAHQFALRPGTTHAPGVKVKGGVKIR